MKCNCWMCSDGNWGHHEDALPIDFGWTEVKYKKKAKPKPHKRQGCPGNDYGQHVYVWEECGYLSFNQKYYMPMQRKVCCGCGKRTGRGKYQPRRLATPSEIRQGNLNLWYNR